MMAVVRGKQEPTQPQQFSNKRREERSLATGDAILRIDGDQKFIVAEMVDISPNGLRVRYRGTPLSSGTQVGITYPWGDIKAVIVWVRFVDEWCDVGFLIKK